jgi:hypothetical protein
MRARKGEMRNQRHGGEKKVVRFLNGGGEICSIASRGIDAPEQRYMRTVGKQRTLAVLATSLALTSYNGVIAVIFCGQGYRRK